MISLTLEQGVGSGGLCPPMHRVHTGKILCSLSLVGRVPHSTWRRNDERSGPRPLILVKCYVLVQSVRGDIVSQLRGLSGPSAGSVLPCSASALKMSASRWLYRELIVRFSKSRRLFLSFLSMGEKSPTKLIGVFVGLICSSRTWYL